MKKKIIGRKIDDNNCYICKEKLGSEFYVLNGKKICLKCFNSKYIANEYKKQAKRIFI